MQVTRKNFQVQLWSYEHIDPIYSKIDCVDGGGIVAGVGIVVGGVVVVFVCGGFVCGGVCGGDVGNKKKFLGIAGLTSTSTQFIQRLKLWGDDEGIVVVVGGVVVGGVGVGGGGVVVVVGGGSGVVVVVGGGGGEFSGDGGWYISLHQNNPLLVLVE